MMTFVERFDAIFDGARVEIADEIFAPEFIGHLPLAPSLNRDGWKTYVQAIYTVMPDLGQAINEVIISGNWLVLRVTYAGTYRREPWDNPIPVSMESISLFRLNQHGLAAEIWSVVDAVGFYAQISAFPASQDWNTRS